jgi:hypothetical protein
MSWLIAGVPADVAHSALAGRACDFFNLTFPATHDTTQHDTTQQATPAPYATSRTATP